MDLKDLAWVAGTWFAMLAVPVLAVLVIPLPGDFGSSQPDVKRVASRQVGH